MEEQNLEEVWSEFFGGKKEETPKEVPTKEEESPKEEAPLKEEPKEEISEEEVEEGVHEEKVPVPPPKKVEIKEEEFDLSEDKGTGKMVLVIYGHKGEGKTYCAFTLPGKIACLSFDRKSLPVVQVVGDGGRIKVWDAIRYEDDSSPEKWLESAVRTFRYINLLLDKVIAQFEPDWIVIDGSEILQRVCELVMRYNNSLMPFQGIANKNLWKERRLYIRQVHNKALSIAKRGLVYTTYIDKDRIVVEGELVAERDVPRWIDAILYETDVVVKVESTYDRMSGKKFYVTIESSKWPGLRTGLRFDATEKGLKEVIK